MIKLQLFLNDLLNLVNEYNDIFFQNFRKDYKTDFTQYWDIYVLNFGFLKIIDSAVEYSREDVLNFYNAHKDISNIETLLFRKSVYPSNEELGFYNISNLSLSSLCEINEEELDKIFYEYLNSYSSNVKQVFEGFEINTMVDFLYANGFLKEFIIKLNNIEFNTSNINSYQKLNECYENFLDEFYRFKSDNDGNNEFGLNSVANDVLSNILISNYNITEKYHITIFDPACRNGNLLFKVKKMIKQINPQCKVGLYGKELDNEEYTICLSRMVIGNDNTSHIIKTKDVLSQFIDDIYIDFDLIVSDFAFHQFKYGKSDNDIFENYIYEYFLKKMNPNSKLVMTLPSSKLDDMNTILSIFPKLDFLESIIYLPLHNHMDYSSVLVLNLNKSEKTKDKFLLIDETDFVLSQNNEKDWSLSMKEVINKIINSYNNFKGYKNGKIIYNSFMEDTSKFQDWSSPIENSINELFNAGMDVGEFFDDGIISKYLQKNKLNLTYESKDIELVSHVNNLNSNNDEKYQSFMFNPKNFLYDQMNPVLDNLLFKKERKILKDEVKFCLLGDLADLSIITKKNEKDSILVSANKYLDDIIFYNSEVSDFNNQEFIEVNLKSEEVLKEYIYVYLKSNKGQDEIKYFSKGNSVINPHNLLYIRIPIPSVESQKNIIKAVNESNEFFTSVELLKKEFQDNILDYEHMSKSINEFIGEIQFDSNSGEFTKMGRNWRHVYDGLLWPLAITYLSATKGGFEIVEKAEKYLILFEFIAAFNCYILLSGMPDDFYHSVKWKIWDADNLRIYEQMTFGKWVRICENLSKIYKNHDFKLNLDKELFDALTSDNILNILNIAKNIRNNQAHGVIQNSFEAEKIVSELDIYLSSIFDILRIYSNYKLIYVTGKISMSKGNFKHQVILLNGPCAQPIYDEVVLNYVLEEDYLYLYNPNNAKILQIKNKFMKFHPIDEFKRHWALFLYYACDRTGYMETNAKYKCFQQKEEDIITKISTFKEDIIN